ncbi:hypothetical protein GCM10027341_15190 [Spirosoma knui]
MVEYGIVDIPMRMLKVKELKLIQGFPANYALSGTQTHQRKFIGNSVAPAYPKAWMQAIGMALTNLSNPVPVGFITTNHTPPTRIYSRSELPANYSIHPWPGYVSTSGAGGCRWLLYRTAADH